MLQYYINKYGLHINGIILIGAHHGAELSMYRRNDIHNLILFEPIRENYNNLLRHIGNDDRAYNIALGNKRGTIDMYVEKDNMGMSCSILKPKLHLTQYPWIHFKEKETVNIDLLDNYGFDTTTHNMICIDVQGYEIEVIKGGMCTFSKVDYIMSEINLEELYEDCAKIDELKDMLDKLGFELLEKNWGIHGWGDGLFINKKKLNLLA